MEEKMIPSPKLEAHQAKQPSTPNSQYSICKSSHEITKPRPRPKIRIIHLFPPKIIKTDISNFRELVQRLTGKQANSSNSHNVKARRPVAVKAEPVAVKAVPVAVKAEPVMPAQFADEKPRGLGEEKYIKREGDEIDPNGLISGLEDIDGFIQSLIQFPLIPLDHLNFFEVEKKTLLQAAET